MKEKMYINQVEQITEVSKRNIRFYENEGLLTPERDGDNGYRQYSESDIWRIKVIKMLRMLDMPLDEIKDVLEEEQTLEQAVSSQKERLEKQASELQAAILFCGQLQKQKIQTLDVDQCLKEMKHTGVEQFFKSWMNDYKKLKEQNKNRDFTFMPDGAVTNPREFTIALCEFADKEKIDLVITKESMYPEFTIDGVEYTAERFYSSVRGIPVAHIRCSMKDREVKGDNIQTERKDILWFLHKWGLVLAVVIINILMIWKWLGSWYRGSLEEWVILIALLVMEGVGLYYGYLFHYNEKVD